MGDKLIFSVDNATLIDDRPSSSFSTLLVDFFASGKNRHDTYISEDTLLRTADTIKNVPLVWKYDPRLDDAYTHDPEQSPCGFVPESSQVESKRLPDGRLMLSVKSYIWKKYSGRIMEFFKRDGKKPVSVEISVFDTLKRPDGLTEILDYCFEAITILGSFVQPAIPLANASVVQFSDDYNRVFEMEFGKYGSLDFSIPSSVKKNVEKGMTLYQKNGKGNSISLSHAKYILKNEKVSPERAKHLYKTLSSKRYQDEILEESDEYVSLMLCGGRDAFSWSKTLCEKMSEIDNKKISYFDNPMTFPYKNIDDVNPALRGINPPITLEQANLIAKQADAIGSDDKKNGWAIAISNFKKTHEVVDGRWIKKEKEEMSVNPEDELDKMAENQGEPQEEFEVKPKEEEEENEEGESEEEEVAEGDKEYSLDPYLDIKAMLAFLENETEVYKEVAEEFAKPYAEMNYGRVMGAMYSYMCKMANMCKMMAEEKETAYVKMAEMEESAKAYMAENEELKKFKSEKEKADFSFAVDTVLKEIFEKVQIPADEISILKEKSNEFDMQSFDAWKNLAKARALDFSVKESNRDENYKRYPFHIEGKGKKTQSPWSR